MTKMQTPSGGCTNCGGVVRTRKSQGWVCARCEYDLTHTERITAGPDAGLEPHRAEIIRNWSAAKRP